MTALSIRARTVVVDLEGTTSATAFILGDLYDYARPRLLPWLRDRADDGDVRIVREQTIAAAALPANASDEDVAAALQRWMDDDVKATPLKTLQGEIWAEGFRRGELSAHFFDDVAPRLRAWHADGAAIAVFSSGSVALQRPWFAQSPSGDLTPLVTAYFDTVNGGPKKEPESYRRIAAQLGRTPAELVFLTDSPDEIRAASAAGWQAVAVSRPGEPWHGADLGTAPTVASFDDLEISTP